MNYSDRPDEQKQRWIEEYIEDMKAHNKERRVNRKAEQQDATFAFKHIANEVRTRARARTV